MVANAVEAANAKKRKKKKRREVGAKEGQGEEAKAEPAPETPGAEAKDSDPAAKVGACVCRWMLIPRCCVRRYHPACRLGGEGAYRGFSCVQAKRHGEHHHHHRKVKSAPDGRRPSRASSVGPVRRDFPLLERIAPLADR